MGVTICETKRRFYTVFEAEVFAERYDDEMVVYACGDHFHHAHKDRQERRGFGGGKKFKRCTRCGDILPRKRLDKHKCRRD